MLKSVCIAAFAFIFFAAPVWAADQAGSYVPDLKPVGSGRLSVFMMDVYDAMLMAPGGRWQQGDPLALQLTYLREIKGHKIADRSVEEMRHIGVSNEIKLAAWHAQMRRIFPDVYEGVTITGILTSDGESIFLKDGHEIGRIKDADFGDAFFGIWLSEKTNSPSLRQKLLGVL